MNLLCIARNGLGRIASNSVAVVKKGVRAVCTCANMLLMAIGMLFTSRYLAMGMMAFALLFTPMGAFAQELAGTGYEAGTAALEEVASEIVKYLPYVVNLCYALAGIVAVIGAISVYVAMNNEEQDIKKKIMMVVGACIFLIAAANALPLFFGISN